jgi:hypothetical protein
MFWYGLMLGVFLGSSIGLIVSAMLAGVKRGDEMRMHISQVDHLGAEASKNYSKPLLSPSGTRKSAHEWSSEA